MKGSVGRSLSHSCVVGEGRVWKGGSCDCGCLLGWLAGWLFDWFVHLFISFRWFFRLRVCLFVCLFTDQKLLQHVPCWI